MTGRWSEAELVAMIPELLAARHMDDAGYDAYAGIGSRETPLAIANEMTEVGAEMERRGFRLRSGGADGKKDQAPGTKSADISFEQGISDRANKDIFVPWKGFANNPDGIPLPKHLEQRAFAIAEKAHPAWDRCSDAAKKLHTRNVPQVLGLDLETPAKAVICWTSDGGATGGTGQAIRIANANDIPVLNMQREAIRNAVLKELGIERQKDLEMESRAVDVARAQAQAREPRQADLWDDRASARAHSNPKAFDFSDARRASRQWKRSECAVFFKVREENGKLSNMANNHPYEDGGLKWKSSEAQYHAMRFPHRPDLQAKIYAAETAMDAKAIARENAAHTRPDWNDMNVEGMAYVITRKLQSESFARELQGTNGKPIVEQSSRDAFWGAMGFGEVLTGQNVLGGLLDQLYTGARQDELPKGTTFPTPEEMRALLSPPKEQEAARPSAGTGSVVYVQGDVAADKADVIVNTVNSKLSIYGNPVMGKGVALAFKERFPSIMKPYGDAIRSGELTPGRALLFDLPDGRKWAALATKDEFRDPSKMEWVESGLKELAEKMKAAGLRSIAMPPPGCGNGGLDWAKVEPLVLDAMKDFDLTLYATPSGGRAADRAVAGHKAEPVQATLARHREESWGNDFPKLGSRPRQNMGMYFAYERNRRPGFESDTTFKAILAGERTSTTRFAEHGEKLNTLKPGDVVRFYERGDFWKKGPGEDKGRYVDVVVRGMNPIDLASCSAERLEEWSKVEGWSVEHGRTLGRQKGAGVQLRYEAIPGQEILKERDLGKSQAAESEGYGAVEQAFVRQRAFGR